MNRRINMLLLLAVFTLSANSIQAQEDWPTFTGTVHYLNLSKGNVKLTPSTVTGYGWENGTWKSVSWTGQTNNHVYYILMDPNDQFDGDPKHMSYNYVTTTEGGTLNVVNNTDVEGVIANWDAKARAAGRTPTPYHIEVSCNQGYNIVLDNVWSSYQKYTSDRTTGGLGFVPKTTGAYCNVILIGDNRLGNVHFHTTNPNHPEGGNNVKNARLIFTSAEGDGKTKGTLVVADVDPSQTFDYSPYDSHATYNHYNSVIGGSDEEDVEYSKGIEIHGGTIWAGALDHDNCTAIGAGGNGYGTVKISGGSVTAVTSSTGTAIGGGIGWTATGGQAEVEISGGTVYAYNKGFVAKYDGTNRFVPATAIGGGSSFVAKCNPTTVNITGGTVYAESVGGVCIGGGGSGLNHGGKGIVKISGASADVTAKSLPGRIYDVNDPNIYRDVPAGAGIGGGTGGETSGKNGGDSEIEITGGKLLTGSVGGGKTNNASGKIGSATVKITGGDIQAQFVMAGGSAGHCSFAMSGGTIHNTNTLNPTNDFYYLNEDGGALWMDDVKGIATMSGGAIYENKANNGGAFYLTGGTLDITGGKIYSNEASTNGGAFFMNGGDVTIKDGLVSGNSSVSGGGVYVEGGNFTFTNGDVNGNTASMKGGGAYVSGGDVTFKGNLSGNTAANGGGLYLGPGAAMEFQGGLIIENHAEIPDGATPAGTAYHGISSNIMGCGGGVYLQNGTSAKNTTLTFKLDPNDKTFGLYTNSASMAGDDLVAEGQYTEVVLPSIKDMQLYGFDGKDATPFWYQDYFTRDEKYGEDDGHAVENPVEYVGRFREILNQFTNEYYNHRIPDERLGTIKNNYLCLTLSYNMLDITITANHILGYETALFQLIRHGSMEDKKYDVLVKYDAKTGKASRTLRNMPWGTYSIFPNDAWNWAYEKIAPQQNLRLGETGNYEFIFDMEHKNGAEVPQHDERSR